MPQGDKRARAIEFWRWRYRDPESGSIMLTMVQPTADEAGSSPEAERIEGSMVLREAEPADFQETVPQIGRLGSD